MLGEIASDAISAIHWNTAQWADSSLHAATNGNHDALERLANADLSDKPQLQPIADAIRTYLILLGFLFESRQALQANL
ncbi:MAG: hypothetical protein AAF483_26155 [Planctomycetota bacterium]